MGIKNLVSVSILIVTIFIAGIMAHIMSMPEIDYCEDMYSEEDMINFTINYDKYYRAEQQSILEYREKNKSNLEDFTDIFKCTDINHYEMENDRFCELDNELWLCEIQRNENNVKTGVQCGRYE